VGTNLLTVNADTSTLYGSRLWVHSTTKIGGELPNGVSAGVCDVSSNDTLHIGNPLATSSSWGVTELEFYTSIDCSGSKMPFVEADSNVASRDSNPYDRAFDANFDNCWVSECAGDAGQCAPGEVMLGIVGVCSPEEVRCVRIRQCYPFGDNAAHCPADVVRVSQIDLFVRGEQVYRWENLLSETRRRGESPNRAYDEEHLVLPGCRRQAAFTRVSEEPQYQTLQQTVGYFQHGAVPRRRDVPVRRRGVTG